jgi:hypothetical protein
MTHSDGKAIVRRLCENGSGLQSLTGTLGTGALVHAPSGAVFESLADVRLRVEDQIAEGDLVASRLVVSGEAPHATPVRMTAMAMHRLLGEQIVEVWLSLDLPNHFHSPTSHPSHTNNELKEIPMQTVTSPRAPMDTASTPMPVASDTSARLSRVILPIALVVVATIAVLVTILAFRDTSDSPASTGVVRSVTAAESAIGNPVAVVRSASAAEQPVVNEPAIVQSANAAESVGPIVAGNPQSANAAERGLSVR